MLCQAETRQGEQQGGEREEGGISYSEVPH